jgi:hypothetical protein
MRSLVSLICVLGVATSQLTGCYAASSAPVPNAGGSQSGELSTPFMRGIGLQRLIRPDDTCPVAVGWPIAGNLTPDGDFDGAPLPPTSAGHVFYPANNYITSTQWLVGGVGIDFVNFTYWPSPPPAANNVCKVDLDATPGDGSISETFNTAAGHIYHVKFWFSGSSGASQQSGPNTMQVSAANNSQMYTWNAAGGHDVGHDKWKLHKFKFKATTCPTTLTFASLDPPSWSSGPVVTEISVLGTQVAQCPAK